VIGDEKGNLLFTEIRNYTDTADQGDDYLCSINYGVYQGEAYVLNVIYTKAPMEETEPATAAILFNDKVNVADIESNNGGRGFGRSVERILKEKFKSNRTQINMFHQSKNKKARILSNATWVMNHIYFPVNWADCFPEYYAAMTKYQKEGKNLHDDAPDATTGIAEKIGQGDRFSFE
jgi:predicted phage terminase large subunit-like protein